MVSCAPPTRPWSKVRPCNEVLDEVVLDVAPPASTSCIDSKKSPDCRWGKRADRKSLGPGHVPYEKAKPTTSTRINETNVAHS